MYKKIIALFFFCSCMLTTMPVQSAEYFLYNKMSQAFTVTFVICEMPFGPCGEQQTKTVQPNGVFRGEFETNNKILAVRALEGYTSERRSTFGITCFSSITRPGQQAILLFDALDKIILCRNAGF